MLESYSPKPPAFYPDHGDRCPVSAYSLRVLEFLSKSEFPISAHRSGPFLDFQGLEHLSLERGSICPHHPPSWHSIVHFLGRPWASAASREGDVLQGWCPHMSHGYSTRAQDGASREGRPTAAAPSWCVQHLGRPLNQACRKQQRRRPHNSLPVGSV